MATTANERPILGRGAHFVTIQPYSPAEPLQLGRCSQMVIAGVIRPDWLTCRTGHAQTQPVPDQYVPYSAAWFTLSVINAGLAQSKGRSGLTWWLVSLLLGPLATLLIVAWPALQPGEPEFPPGRMSRSQAAIIGVIVLIVALGVFGLVSFGLSSGK